MIRLVLFSQHLYAIFIRKPGGKRPLQPNTYTMHTIYKYSSQKSDLHTITRSSMALAPNPTNGANQLNYNNTTTRQPTQPKHKTQTKQNESIRQTQGTQGIHSFLFIKIHT